MKALAYHFIIYNPVLKGKKKRTKIQQRFHTWAKKLTKGKGVLDISQAAFGMSRVHAWAACSAQATARQRAFFSPWKETTGEKAPLCSQTIAQNLESVSQVCFGQEASFPLGRRDFPPGRSCSQAAGSSRSWAEEGGKASASQPKAAVRGRSDKAKWHNDLSLTAAQNKRNLYMEGWNRPCNGKSN